MPSVYHDASYLSPFRLCFSLQIADFEALLSWTFLQGRSQQNSRKGYLPCTEVPFHAHIGQMSRSSK